MRHSVLIVLMGRHVACLWCSGSIIELLLPVFIEMTLCFAVLLFLPFTRTQKKLQKVVVVVREKGWVTRLHAQTYRTIELANRLNKTKFNFECRAMPACTLNESFLALAHIIDVTFGPTWKQNIKFKSSDNYYNNNNKRELSLTATFFDEKILHQHRIFWAVLMSGIFNNQLVLDRALERTYTVTFRS